MKNHKRLSIPGSLMLVSLVWYSMTPAIPTANRSVPNRPPNILFILSDDHTAQAISAYGSKVAQTPNIDRLAKEGALFQNMFVANSICGPSRAHPADG